MGGVGQLVKVLRPRAGTGVSCLPIDHCPYASPVYTSSAGRPSAAGAPSTPPRLIHMHLIAPYTQDGVTPLHTASAMGYLQSVHTQLAANRTGVDSKDKVWGGGESHAGRVH